MAAFAADFVGPISMALTPEIAGWRTTVRNLMAGTTVQEKHGIANHPFIAHTSAWTSQHSPAWMRGPLSTDEEFS